MKNLEPAEPERRYEGKRPGEMIHLDNKKLGRFNRTGHCEQDISIHGSTCMIDPL
jgi:hypothetical protein